MHIKTHFIHAILVFIYGCALNNQVQLKMQNLCKHLFLYILEIVQTVIVTRMYVSSVKLCVLNGL